MINSDPMIEVPASWLEGLANKADTASNDVTKWPLGDKEQIPVSVQILIGFSSSARTLLRLKKPKTK